MDYYSILGLNKTASDDEIKQAYRKMAMKHHPDRGGDEKRFKEISQAYDVLSSPEKKKMFDMGMDPNNPRSHQGFNQGPFEFHFGTDNINDFFGNFGFSGFGSRPMRRNASFNIGVQLTLEEVLTGKEIAAEVGTKNGKKRLVNISVPAGIDDGQQIRYQGMGDDSISGLPPGDLIVNVTIAKHEKFYRDRENLLYEHRIPVWDSLLGTTVDLETLDKRIITISIPPGTQPETILSCRGEGLPSMRNRQRGNLLIKIKIDIPRNLTTSQIQKIKEVKDGI